MPRIGGGVSPTCRPVERHGRWQRQNSPAVRSPPFAAARFGSSKNRLNPSGSAAGMCAASGYEKYWFSRLTRMMRHGKPVPGTHWLFWYRPRQTPVATFQSRSKSDTLTAVPAFVFHQRSAVGSVGGNFVYWIVSRISPVNLSGGGRI